MRAEFVTDAVVLELDVDVSIPDAGIPKPLSSVDILIYGEMVPREVLRGHGTVRVEGLLPRSKARHRPVAPG